MERQNIEPTKATWQECNEQYLAWEMHSLRLKSAKGDKKEIAAAHRRAKSFLTELDGREFGADSR